MTAQELRIGNLVKINDKHPNIPYHNLHVEIIGIDSENFLKEKGLVGSATVKQIHFTSGIWIDYLQPIPLTEEWLLKFRIGKQNGYPYKFNKGYLKIRNGNFFFKHYDIEIYLPFVHDLQNLYYALTNKELCLK